MITGETCFPVLYAEDAANSITVRARVFSDLIFTCQGKVTAVKFNGESVGQFYIDSWEWNNGQGILRSKAKVVADQTGVQTYTFESGKELLTNPGEVLGFHYDSGTSPKVRK